MTAAENRSWSRTQGAAVVRIQDSDGGAEGYTFDLVWRGAGFGSNPTGQPLGGRDRGASPNDAARACQDAVRERANQQYGFRDITFRGLNADDNPGRNDRIMGSFDVRQGRDAERADRYAGRDNAISACQRAAEQRIQPPRPTGNNGRTYDFEIRCAVNPDNGSVRSIQVNRRYAAMPKPFGALLGVPAPLLL